jgi:hypothetical protein
MTGRGGLIVIVCAAFGWAGGIMETQLAVWHHLISPGNVGAGLLIGLGSVVLGALIGGLYIWLFKSEF